MKAVNDTYYILAQKMEGVLPEKLFALRRRNSQLESI